MKEIIINEPYIEDIHVECVEHSVRNAFITTLGEVHTALQSEIRDEQVRRNRNARNTPCSFLGTYGH
jgi:hypothetical protein